MAAKAQQGSTSPDETQDDGQSPMPSSPTSVRFRRPAKALRGLERLLQVGGYDPKDDWDVPHSGTVGVDGRPQYDKSPHRGAAIQTLEGTVVNHKGRPIDENGRVIDPDKYDSEDSLYG
jgi:hypothetical protein